MLKKVALFFVLLVVILIIIGSRDEPGTEKASRPLAAGEMTTPINTNVAGLEPLTGEALAEEQRLCVSLRLGAVMKMVEVGQSDCPKNQFLGMIG